VDIIKLAQQVETELQKIKKPIKVAVMGCAVNGPGEARDADVGIACGKNRGILFRNGRKIGMVEEGDFLQALMAEVHKL
jgi:(E)-4-hydroxy-3-methylbut-2-enyl-diphosphate synthase